MNIKVNERIKQQIHKLNAMGVKIGTIASRFGISPETVSKHLDPAYHYKQSQKIYYFISPDGIEHRVENVAKFARKHNLNPSLLHRLVSNKRYHHKGWTFSRVETSKEL